METVKEMVVQRGIKIEENDIGTHMPGTQSAITSYVVAQVERKLENNERLRFLRRHGSVRRIKAWLICSPSTELRSYIGHRDYVARMRYHCGYPQVEEGSACPRTNCGKELDSNGEHLLICHKPMGHTKLTNRRHDAVVKVIARWLNMAGMSNEVEKTTSSEVKTRPDITVHTPEGGQIWLDVVISHMTNPLA